ncbi:MAG TPA: hypothetical protein VH637_06880 [Streptosporangiaceae bacterium]
MDDAAVEAVDPLDLPDRLGLSEEDKGGPLGNVAMAFHYMTGEKKKGSTPGYFGPVVERSNGTKFPPPIKDLPAETGALWEAVGTQATKPLVRARLNDLCFEGRWGIRGKVARHAIEAYLLIGEEGFSASREVSDGRQELGAAGALIRALDLARKIRDDSLAQRAITSLVNAATKCMENDHPAPGVAHRLLHALSDDRATVPELANLLSQARLIFQGDIWHTEDIISLQLRQARGDPEAMARLQRENVEGWIAEADKSNGIARLAHLESAAQKAHAYGLTDLAAKVTRKLQATNPDELGLVRRKFSIEIPTEEIERYLAFFTDAPSWQNAFERLICLDPPTGNIASNHELVDQIRTEAPLYHLLTPMRIGGDGLPRFTASSDEERDEWRLAEQERLSLDLRGPLVTEALRRIWSKWGPVTEDDLVTFLSQGGHVPQGMSRSLARAFLRHFAGDFEGSAYTLMPKVEGLVRRIVVQCNMPVYATQRRKKPGQYLGLGALLPVLANLGIDESWFRFLHTFFASVAGFNERNELLHGFIDDVGEVVSALIILAVIYLSVGLRLTDSGGSQ